MLCIIKLFNTNFIMLNPIYSYIQSFNLLYFHKINFNLHFFDLIKMYLYADEVINYLIFFY
jgi:hypothetical protein